MNIYNHYKVDGTIAEITTEEPISLDQMQDLVQGSIEAITLKDGTTLIINEDGYYMGLPVNPSFTEDNPLLENISTLGGIKGDAIQGVTDFEKGEFMGMNHKDELIKGELL